MRDTATRQSLGKDVPGVFIAPEGYEPLFDVARQAGYDWTACNLRAPTERLGETAGVDARFRLDWFFSRGLTCAAPRNLLAQTPDGVELSDHDAIGVDITLP